MKRKIALLSFLFLFAAYLTVNAQNPATDGIIKFDKAVYTGFSTKPVITLTDADLNASADKKDEISVMVNSSSDPGGITVTLVEESTNSGVFRGYFNLSPTKSDDKNKTLKIAYNDRITALYNDKSNSSGKTASRSCGSIWKTTTGTVELNKDVYTGLYTPATVTVKDHDLNLDPSAVDKVNVTVTSSADPKGITLLLRETSINTGIFTGTLKFNTSISSGISGVIKVGTESSLTVQYADLANSDNQTKTVTASSVFQFTEAIIGTSAENDHGTGNMIDIIVNEPDSNNPERVDFIYVKVGAGGSTDGMTVRLDETGIDTGIFKQTVYFTDRAANKKLLYMAGANKLSIKYVDQTIPQGGSKEIIKTVSWEYQSTVINLDKESYTGYNSSAEIILYNMELNSDSSETDYVYVDIEASNSKSIRIKLKETKSSSGAFKGTLYFGEKTDEDDNKIKMEGADSFTVSYKNRRNPTDVSECSAFWSPQDGILTLNRQVYYGNATAVSISLEDWDVADDSSERDEVSVYVKVPGTSRRRTITLNETKRDSGIFTRVLYINGGSSKNPSIDMNPGETIEVSYTDEDTSHGSEEIRTVSAIWAGISEPKLTTDKPSYKGYGTEMVITLKDPDYNKLTSAQETVDLMVYTSNSIGGVRYILKETGANTGVFTATLKLSKDVSGYNYVKVGDTDTITVTFVDKDVSVKAGFVK